MIGIAKNHLMNTVGRFDNIFVKGKGCELFDKDGTRYLDFISGIAVNCLGHSSPVVLNALNKQASKIMQISNYCFSEANLELAEKLCEYSGNHDYVFFCNSGTEAVEAALKLSRKYGMRTGNKNKNVLVHMENSFHGRTMGALSVTGRKKYQKDFEPLIGGVKSAVFNDIESLKKVMDDNVCGVILEPIQGEGGLIVADKEYLKEVRALCDKFNALLIFDEVQCGIGRTGKLFAYKNFDAVPDIVCMAKALAGGFPIGAIISNKRAGTFEPGDHNSTFGGNALACAVSLAVLHELVEGGVVDKVNEKSRYFVHKLEELKEKHSVIKEIRGMGLLLGIRVGVEPHVIINKCYDKKLLLISAGADVIRFLPPLNVENKYIDEACEILDEVLE